MKLKMICLLIIFAGLIACNMLFRPVKTTPIVMLVSTGTPVTPESQVISTPVLNYVVNACNESIKTDNANLVTITSNGSQVLVEQEAGYVCCAKIDMEVKREGSLIKIIESNTGEMCKCICGYHASAQVSGLEPGRYHVQVWGIQFKDVQDLTLLGEEDITITTQKSSNKPATAKPLPDLMTDRYEVHYFACPWGEPGEVRGWVKNIGDGNAGPFQVEIDGGLTTLPGLLSGLGAWASVPFASGPVGGVRINIDPNNAIQETDKSNNQYEIVFTPPPQCKTATPNDENNPAITLTPFPVQTLTFKVLASERWNMPEAAIHKGDTVQIRYVSGNWTYSPTVMPLDANGDGSSPTCGATKPGARCAEPLPYAPKGALIATYENPVFFLVGNVTTFIAPRDGYLSLKMNAAEDDQSLQNRSGEILVEITIRN